MFFQKGKLYRHKNCLDVDVFVVSHPDDYGEEIFMKVKYWNRHSKVFQPDLLSFEAVLVKKQHIKNWMLLDETL